MKSMMCPRCDRAEVGGTVEVCPKCKWKPQERCKECGDYLMEIESHNYYTSETCKEKICISKTCRNHDKGKLEGHRYYKNPPWPCKTSMPGYCSFDDPSSSTNNM